MKKNNFNSFLTPNIKKTCLSQELVMGKNCENFYGATQVPLGIAGPINIINYDPLTNKKSELKKYHLPLATTEGALVASINRGCKATRLSGGIKTVVEEIGAARGPVFKSGGIEDSWRAKKWIENNIFKLKKICQSTSSHLELRNINTKIVGKQFYCRFQYKTCEAMGMNMVTIATERAVKLIEKETGAKCLSLSGNYCVDKKPSWLNFILGRGKQVWAECLIKKSVVKSVLKTSAEAIVSVVQNKDYLGSIVSGSMAFNGHFANIAAAIFLATGQDLAHVVEAALGITNAQTKKNGDLYFSIYMPDLMVGTVGGGTGLPTQKEALSILGLSNKTGDAQKLASIIAAAVLAGELSLTAALAAGQLAEAHQKLGRGK